jgi:AcrR family transcriptional regulator
MTVLSRRERDRLRRETLILDAAEDLLLAHGYLGLNLDRLAERVEYSKGTLYNHFATKEDILLALASRNLAERVRLFERAAAFEGRTRERILAIGIADDVLAERGSAPFQIMQMAKTPSLWEKTDPTRRQESARFECRCSEVVESVIRDAVRAGDLKLNPREGKELGFGLMTMCLGTNLVTTAPDWKESLGLKPRQALRANQHRLLDGVNWRPLTKDWNYAASEKRIRAAVFEATGRNGVGRLEEE